MTIKFKAEVIVMLKLEEEEGLYVDRGVSCNCEGENEDEAVERLKKKLKDEFTAEGHNVAGVRVLSMTRLATMRVVR